MKTVCTRVFSIRKEGGLRPLLLFFRCAEDDASAGDRNEIEPQGYSSENIRIVSIGTCSPEGGILPKKSKPRGLIGSFLSRQLFLTVMESQEELTKALAKQLLGSRYVRIDFNPNPKEASVLGLDSATDNVKTVLLRSADQAVKNLSRGELMTLNSMLGTVH